MTNHLTSLDLCSLSLVIGGAAGAPAAPQDPDPKAAGRTWGQVGREYASACVSGAGQALIYGGKPKNFKAGAMSAAAGCAMGMGTKAFDDAGAWMSGER